MALTTIDPTTALVVVDLRKGIVSDRTGHPLTAVVKQATHLATTAEVVDMVEATR